MAAHRLYAGSYAAADRPGLYTFDFDAATGALTAQGALAGIANPSFLALHPTRPWLYAVSETHQQEDGAPGAVWAVRREDATGHMELINGQPSGGDWPCHLAIDASGRWLVVSNYGTGSVGVLPIQADGALGELTDLVQHEGRGPDPERQTGPHAHSAIFSPDGRFLIVADLGMDALLIYRFDGEAGRLAPHVQVATSPGTGPRHMAWQPGAPRLYVAHELASRVAVYDYDPAAGALQERHILDTLPPQAPRNWVADIHVTPEGDRVFVSNRGHESLAVFDILPDGALVRVAVAPCGGQWPRNFALAPDGRFAVVANQYSDAIVVLPLDSGPAAVGAPVAQAAIPGASCVLFAAPGL
jgi:6-phosphogluconolactonase